MTFHPEVLILSPHHEFSPAQVNRRI